MSEDFGVSPTAAWPERATAVTTVPAALSPERLAQWPVVVHTEGLDETAYTLIDVRHDPDDAAVCIQRQQWSFDEDVRTWLMDTNDEWWLPGHAAAELGGLLAALGGWVGAAPGIDEAGDESVDGQRA